MEERAINPDTFLEPVYLNEKMVLNCAAYVFKGYSLESETNDTTKIEHSRVGKAGFNFLERLISLGGEAGSKASRQNKLVIYKSWCVIVGVRGERTHTSDSGEVCRD